MCPGTDAYMPPEAVKDKPVYTVKIDCFAIGTLIIQILTRCFPEPGDRQKTIQTDHPQYSGGIVEVRVSEIERRQNHISQVDPNHPLLPIALHCLKDSDVERPSAQQLCHRVAALKETPQFTQSVTRAQERPEPGNTTEREEEIRELQQVQDKDEENRQMRQEHAQQIEGLQQIIGTQNNRLQEKDNIKREKNDIIREKELTIVTSQKECQQLRGQLQHVTQQLASSQQVTAQFQTQIQGLEQQQLHRKSPTEVLAKPQPSLRDPPQTYHSEISTRAVTRDSFTLRWREAKKAPCGMIRGPNAIVDGDMVYLRTGGTRKIYTYKSTDETWNQLPECKTQYCSLAVVNNLLTTIGGRNSGDKVTNQLFSLTGEGRGTWREVFQSMPTKRSSSVAMCTGQALIVAGGVDQDLQTLRTVEAMDIDTKEWSPAADLPDPLYRASITLCQDCIYIIGGFSGSKSTTSVYTITLTNLFLPRRSRSLGERLAQSLSALTRLARSNVWNKVADLPVTLSTCVTLHGRLLAIGGCDFKNTPTSDVHIYHPTSNPWEVISKMNISRDYCFAAVLPSNKLMVVGGRTTSSFSSETDSVEIATVV